jgi:alpha-beta hydrolase superfamily lysophospholipase
MPARRKEREDEGHRFDAVRFRFFVTLAMRAILVRDRIAMLGRSPGAAAAGLNNPVSCTVSSGSRRLDARLALPRTTPSASVLLLHGIGERLEYWSGAQQLLAGRGIASLLIGYSGYGKSEGAVTPANLRQDALAGYAELQRRVPGPQPPFVLGLSLGTGVAADAAPSMRPAPSGVILCEAFSSLRDAAEAVCRSLPLLRYAASRLAKLMPDLYRTASSIGIIGAPLLIVHSDSDELFPAGMARQIYAAATSDPPTGAALVVLSGYAHNDAYLRPASGYWEPILDFMGGKPDKSRERPASLSKR